jgi:hypothetical protein
MEICVADATNQDSHLQLGHATEIIGKVQQDLSVKVLSSTDLGTDIGTLHFHELPEPCRYCKLPSVC